MRGPGGRDVAEGARAPPGAQRSAGASALWAPFSARPPGARVLRLEGALLAPARRVLPGRLEEHMVGVLGALAAGQGWDEDLQVFPLVKGAFAHQL